MQEEKQTSYTPIQILFLCQTLPTEIWDRKMSSDAMSNIACDVKGMTHSQKKETHTQKYAIQKVDCRK